MGASCSANPDARAVRPIEADDCFLAISPATA